MIDQLQLDALLAGGKSLTVEFKSDRQQTNGIGISPSWAVGVKGIN